MFKLFTQIFGSKYERDVKAYSPIVETTNEFVAEYQSLTHDELRQKTNELKEKIKTHLRDIDEEITALRTDAEEEADFSVKEELYKQLDETLKEKDKALEEVLLTILPEAFAVVKETCRRFVENPTITVDALDHDRNLSVKKPYITIEDGKAHYQNEW
ncbi:MAG TPA: hypothetical protein VN763_12125, partial [Saprospiraceae bacterium]|nr:hypothetical protein [Saprospiraceae bacterium]